MEIKCNDPGMKCQKEQKYYIEIKMRLHLSFGRNEHLSHSNQHGADALYLLICISIHSTQQY